MSRSIPARGLVGPVALALAVLVAGCSGATPSRSELRDALAASGIPADVARCATDAIEDSLSTDEIAQIVERGSGGAPADDPDRTDDSSDRVRGALATCRETLPTTTLPPATTLPGATPVPTSQSGQTSDTTSALPGDGSTQPGPAAGSDVDGSATDDTSPAFDTVPPTSAN